MRSLEIALEPRVGFGRENILVAVIARKRAESVDRHVRQLNSLGFIILRLPDVYAGIPRIDVDVAPLAGSGSLLSAFRLWARAPETPLAPGRHSHHRRESSERFPQALGPVAARR